MNPLFEKCVYGMLCFRTKVFFDLMSPFFNELVDIVTDIAYLYKITDDGYEQYIATDRFVYGLLIAFALLGMIKFFYLLHLTRFLNKFDSRN